MGAMLISSESVPIPSFALELSRRIWNLRARSDRGEDVSAELAAAIAARAQYRCRDV